MHFAKVNLPHPQLTTGTRYLEANLHRAWPTRIPGAARCLCGYLGTGRAASRPVTPRAHGLNHPGCRHALPTGSRAGRGAFLWRTSLRPLGRRKSQEVERPAPVPPAFGVVAGLSGQPFPSRGPWRRRGLESPRVRWGLQPRAPRRGGSNRFGAARGVGAGGRFPSPRRAHTTHGRPGWGMAPLRWNRPVLRAEAVERLRSYSEFPGATRGQEHFVKVACSSVFRSRNLCSTCAA